MKIRLQFFIIFLITQCTLGVWNCLAQDEIDIVDPYQMKVSRSRQADTFYFSQNAAIKSNQHIDTLRTYDVFLEERPTPFGKAYMCNGTEVTKQKFYEYKLLWNAAGACKPCVMYTYDDKEQLKHIAYQYQDCLCGKYIEYFPEGPKKMEGQFMANTSGNWQNLKSRDICNIRDGLWTYYLPNGVVEKTEMYVDGKLKSVTNPAPNSTMSSRKNTPQNSSDENTPKKGLMQRMKDKNKSDDN